MKIGRASHLRGILKLNGDKSISHRAALISALAIGETRIENFSTSADCASTLACLANLGVKTRRENSTVFVSGVGKTGFQKPSAALDCGNSGTTVRLLSGILAGQNFAATLIGDESLSKRPMRRVIEPLELMGAQISANENRLPLTIRGANPLRAISYQPKIASAQVKSCVLLAGLNADGTTGIVEKFNSQNPQSNSQISLTRDHTERMLDWFDVKVETETNGDAVKISVAGDARLTANDLQIPGDISGAAFFLVAASCLENSDLTITNVGLNPTRRAVVDALRNFGAEIEITNEAEICNEPIGDLRVTGKKNLRSKAESNVIGGEIIANLIDEIPILAVFGTQLENGLEIRDAAELRVKESDRIAAIVKNLRLMNAEVEEFADGFRVGKSQLKGAKVDSFGDHRIAMAFAVAALFADGETEIIDADCAKVSFPEFFEVLEGLIK